MVLVLTGRTINNNNIEIEKKRCENTNSGLNKRRSEWTDRSVGNNDN